MEEGGKDLLYTVADGIGHVTFNRPQARNAMTFAMYDGLAKICEQAGADKSMRGAGDHGCGETRRLPPAPTSRNFVNSSRRKTRSTMRSGLTAC